MIKDISAIVPALDSNRYSPDGDLLKFAGTTLIEWKISQLLKIFEKKDVYVSTPSGKIAAIAEGAGVKVIRRGKENNFSDMIKSSASGTDKKYLLWTNTTSPFIGPKHYLAMIKMFLSLDRNKYDSLVSVLKMNEYFFYKGSPMNFDISKFQSRTELEPLFKLTNGCSIALKETCLSYGKDYGGKPFLSEVDKFVATEISEIGDGAMLNDLVAEYFRRDLDITDKALWQEQNK